eukprot:327576-Hanusia_phi.AAC.1
MTTMVESKVAGEGGEGGEERGRAGDGREEMRERPRELGKEQEPHGSERLKIARGRGMKVYRTSMGKQ